MPEISLVLLWLAAKEKWYNCTFLLAENNYKVFKRLLKLESSVQFLNGIFFWKLYMCKKQNVLLLLLYHHSFKAMSFNGANKVKHLKSLKRARRQKSKLNNSSSVSNDLRRCNLCTKIWLKCEIKRSITASIIAF